MVHLLLTAHAVVGVAVLLARGRLRSRAFLVGIVPPLASVAWAVTRAGDVLDGEVVTSRAEWVAGLGLAIDVRLDGFALLMIGLVSGIGSLVFAYGRSYFGDTVRAAQVAGLLTLFAGAMLGLVLADNVMFLFVCWELTSITSYLLIGNDDRDPLARAGALQALLLTGTTGLAMLGGLVVLGEQAGTYRLSALVEHPPEGPAVATGLVLVLIGAFAKSAQYPFHSWLPGAMVAPTPISAYLHSAAMVKAGVYLIAVLAPAFADVGVWRPLVVGVGLFTMIAGGLRALRPHDLKQLLAHGTVSQLGFLVVLFGLGHDAATAAGCALLAAHGLFKAALFMTVGVVDHQAHTRDLRELPVLRGRRWGVVKGIAVVSAASMAALPPLAGFLAKEAAYDALLHGGTAERWVLAGIVAGSALTVAYSLRLAVGLLRPSLIAAPFAESDGAPSPPPPAAAFVAPAAVLAVLSVAVGVAPSLWNGVLDGAATALDSDAHVHLALWHGVSTPLVLSAATIGTGVVLFLARRPVAAVQARLAPPWSGARVYDEVVARLTRAAGAVTRFAQPGSLPVYAAVILLTAAGAPLLALTVGTWWPGWPEVVGSFSYVPVAALLVGAAVAATLMRGRFASALLLGAAGYGMALLFVIQGAPDLALTQFGIETLSILLFLLVLRRLPDSFSQRTPKIGRALRVIVASSVGVFVFLMAIAAAGARSRPPVSEEMTSRALSEAGGRNVVNVILVDFRGLDTLGEITVLVVAAIGATALARARTTRRGNDQAAAARPPEVAGEVPR